MVRELCVRDLVTEKVPIKHLCTWKHDHPRNKLQQKCLTISQESAIHQSSSPCIMSYTTITTPLDWRQGRSSERLPRRRFGRRGAAPNRAHSCAVHNPRTEAFQKGHQSNDKGDNRWSPITIGEIDCHDAWCPRCPLQPCNNFAQWKKTKNLAKVLPRRRWHAHRADWTDYNPQNEIIEQQRLPITQKNKKDHQLPMTTTTRQLMQ